MKQKAKWFLCHEKKKMVLSYWLHWVTTKYPDDEWVVGGTPIQVLHYSCLYQYEEEELLERP